MSQQINKPNIFNKSFEEVACTKENAKPKENKEYNNLIYENENIKEIIGNEVVLMSPVHFLHSRIVSKLFSTIDNKINKIGNKCLVFTDTCAYDLSELKSELGGKGRFVSPDISVVCNPKFKGSRIATYPILIIEVLSPSTAIRDLTIKKELYAQMGVKDYLIVSKEGVVEHFVLVDNSYVGPRIITREESFISSVNPSIELTYDEIFGDIFTNELFAEEYGEEV